MTAVISVQGLLVEVNDGEIIAQQLFDCAETADSNRVHAIVAALNDVVNDCQGQIVVWTNDTLKAKPPH